MPLLKGSFGAFGLANPASTGLAFGSGTRREKGKFWLWLMFVGLHSRRARELHVRPRTARRYDNGWVLEALRGGGSRRFHGGRRRQPHRIPCARR